MFFTGLLKKSLVIKCALAFAVSGFTLVTASSAHAQHSHDIPAIGIAGGASMSIDRERILGDFYMREIRNLAPIADDPVLREYLSDVGNKLVMHTDNVRYPFKFFWVNDPSLNAFAFLGGHVGMHTGLMLEAQDESELAAVLSHEIAHVTQRHIARNMERMEQASSMTMAQLVGSIALAMVNPIAGIASMNATIAGLYQRQINYTRQFELEADRVGMTALARAGFDPEGAPRFFGRLAARYRYSTNPPQMLVTHPLPESRIADTQSRARQLGPVELEPRLDFELAKMRIRVRYSRRSGRDLLEDFISERRGLTHPHKIAANDYGMALVHFRLENYEEAARYIEPLRNAQPLNLFYLDTQTDIWLELGRVEEIINILTSEFMRRPNNQVVTLNLAYAANKGREYDLSRRVLNNYLIHNKDDMLAWQLLHEAQQGSGRAVEAHESMAEIFALRGAFRRAVDELHSGISKTPESNESTRQRLTARIDQIRALESERNRVSTR